MSHGTVHWSECITDDVEGAKAHYAAVLGWTYDIMPMPGGDGVYTVAKKDDAFIAGIMPLSSMNDPNAKPGWMTYLEVADIEAAVSAATSSGGTVLGPPFTVETIGTIAMVAEPGGAVVGFIEPAAAPASDA